MLRLILFLCLVVPGVAQEYKLALIGLRHAHVRNNIQEMLHGGNAWLVGIAETLPDLIADVRQRGATDIPIFDNYEKMLDEIKPDIVWAFVENNRHLEIVRACAARKINVVFEKPLAADYKDALAIRRVARRYGIQVMTNYGTAWRPATYAAKAQADSGAIGKIFRLRGVTGHGGPKPDQDVRFFAWLTDPVKNGAGALMDFGCYNALLSLWYKGRPETVFATVNHLQPETYPKVDDNSVMVLTYKDGVGILENSWDLPRGMGDWEMFGRAGSLLLSEGKVQLRQGRQSPSEVPVEPLPPERSGPIAYMVHCLRTRQPVSGLVGLDINVGVVEIIEAAKRSIRSGRAISLPLETTE